MIQFNFDWHDGTNQVILVLLGLLLAMQLWLLVFRYKSTLTARVYLRLGLNILLWLVVLAFVLQPFWLSSRANHIGLAFGREVTDDLREEITDSLGRGRVMDPGNARDAEALPGIDTLLLMGQSFSKQTFNNLTLAIAKPVLKWIPFYAPDQVYNLSWKAVVRKGEMQTVTGSIKSDREQQLRLCFGDITLDSVKLTKGERSFRLTAPAFVQGRSIFTLKIGNTVLDTLHFFARASKPLSFEFMLESPDFESRSLATWLGKNGHPVVYTTTLSKDLRSTQSINKAKTPDILITDATNASGALVKKTLAAGKSVLFINLAEPLADVSRINTALGSYFTLKRTSQQQEVVVSNGLSAFPYMFSDFARQIKVPKMPVAVEKLNGQVAVSLLNETFPLLLSGDSIAYQRVWNSVLTEVHPSLVENISVTAPVIFGMPIEIGLNNFQSLPELFRIGNDTIFPSRSPLNELSYSARFRPTQSGWISMADSSGSELFVAQQSFDEPGKMRDFISAHNKELRTKNGSDAVRHSISPWIWFSLLLVCFSAVWLETKL
jgi:hypothetical protein